MKGVGTDVDKKEIDRLGLCHQPENEDYFDLFFADTALERRPARNLCVANGGCPVREQCLKWALETKTIWGVWGGRDEDELRRALAVDVNGEPMIRIRFPQCPFCHARPNKLVVVGVCELDSGRRRERVECMTCGFYWRSATSVAAVKAYWRDRQKKLRARSVSKRRIDTGKPQAPRTSAPLPAETGTDLALVASATGAAAAR